MRKILFILLAIFLIQPVYAWDISFFNHNDEKCVKKLLKSQIYYANKNNFNKFVATYDKDYTNADGLDLDEYSKLVKEIWDSYLDVRYDIEIKNITLDGDTAKVDLIETSYAILPESSKMEGELKSESISQYRLRKDKKGKWKVFSESVLDETTSMMYGEAKDLDVKLTVPTSIEADKEYTASLEFVPPVGTMAIASIASDVVEYPQKKAKEVFRALPEDGILERLFTSNSENKNEYIIASIGLTKSEVCDISIKLSLTGYGYMIRRVNVIPEQKELTVEESKNAEN